MGALLGAHFIFSRASRSRSCQTPCEVRERSDVFLRRLIGGDEARQAFALSNAFHARSSRWPRIIMRPSLQHGFMQPLRHYGKYLVTLRWQRQSYALDLGKLPREQARHRIGMFCIPEPQPIFQIGEHLRAEVSAFG